MCIAYIYIYIYIYIWNPRGKLFVHIFVHTKFAYHFVTKTEADWKAIETNKEHVNDTIRTNDDKTLHITYKQLNRSLIRRITNDH